MKKLKYVFTGSDKEVAELALETGLFEEAPAVDSEEYAKVFDKILKEALEVDKSFEEELMQSKETAEYAIKTGHAMVFEGEEGIAYLEIFPFEAEELLGVVNTGIAVKEEYQGNGIATELALKVLELYEKFAKAKGYKGLLYLHPGQGSFPWKFVKKLEEKLKGYKAGILLAGAIGHSASGTYVAVLAPKEEIEKYSYEVLEKDGKVFINPAKPPEKFNSIKAIEAYKKSKLKEAWAKFDYAALPTLVS